MHYVPQIGDLLCARDYATNEASLGMIVETSPSVIRGVASTHYLVEWLDDVPGNRMKYMISDIIHFRDSYRILRESL